MRSREFCYRHKDYLLIPEDLPTSMLLVLNITEEHAKYLNLIFFLRDREKGME